MTYYIIQIPTYYIIFYIIYLYYIVLYYIDRPIEHQVSTNRCPLQLATDTRNILKGLKHGNSGRQELFLELIYYVYLLEKHHNMSPLRLQ